MARRARYGAKADLLSAGPLNRPAPSLEPSSLLVSSPQRAETTSALDQARPLCFAPLEDAPLDLDDYGIAEVSTSAPPSEIVLPENAPPAPARLRRRGRKARAAERAGAEEIATAVQRAQRRQAEERPGEMALPPPRGYVVRQNKGRARRGWYAPLATPALTSTRQAAILNTALVAAPTGADGIVNGRDRLSKTMVAHDPFTAYENGRITSPAVVVLGVIGSGKSSLLKTVYVLRPLILRQRRVVVLDRKDQNGEGEYCEVSRQLGQDPFSMILGGGGTKINPLDPVILAGDGRSGQMRLLSGLAEIANNGQPLSKWERPALRAAHRATLRAAEVDQFVPRLEHLLAECGKTHPEFAGHSPETRERLHQGGIAVRYMLSGLLSDELAGLFDGETSSHVRLADRLTVFDVSQLPDDGPAVSMVMAVANVWLLGMLRRQRGLRTNFIAEEGWDLVGGAAGRVFQRNSKLARGLGLSNIAALHHVADIPTGDPAIAMLKEAQTVHLYRQDRDDDIDAVIRTYGLDPGSRGTLANLLDGHHLLKIGNRREIHVEHIRSRLERTLTNTDDAMNVSGTRRAA